MHSDLLLQRSIFRYHYSSWAKDSIYLDYPSLNEYSDCERRWADVNSYHSLTPFNHNVNPYSFNLYDNKYLYLGCFDQPSNRNGH
jgi:hypothetical protein